MTQPIPDFELVKRFQLGEVSAMDQLVRNEGAPVLNYIRQYVRSMDLADDIFQEAWLKVWRFRESLTQVNQFRGWLYQIVRNVVFDELKNRHWKLNIVFFGDWEEFQLVSDSQPGPDKLVQQKEWGEILSKELQHLDSVSQEIIVMRYIGGLNFREIGEALNLPLQTVYSKAQQSLKKMRTSLAKIGITDF